MLPPRLLRPLRPCHRQRSYYAHIRWATTDARRKLPTASVPGPDDVHHHHHPHATPHPSAQSATDNVCLNCNRSFGTPAGVRKHRLLSDACVDEHQPGGYICRRCFVPLLRREHAQAHARENKKCAGRIHQVRDRHRLSVLEPEIAPVWTANVLQCAESKYRQLLHTSVEVASQLEATADSPHSKSILDKIKQNLQQAKTDAITENDRNILEILSAKSHIAPLKRGKSDPSSAVGTIRAQERDGRGLPSSNARGTQSEGLRLHKHMARSPSWDQLPRPEPDQTYNKTISHSSANTTNNVKTAQSPTQTKQEIEQKEKNDGLMTQVQMLAEQVKLLTEKLDAYVSPSEAASPRLENPTPPKPSSGHVATVVDSSDTSSDGGNDLHRLTRQFQTGTRLMRPVHSPQDSDARMDDEQVRGASKSTPDAMPAGTVPPSESGEAATSDDADDQSLLKELFPEAYNWAEPHYSKRNPYPKLTLPNQTPLIRRTEHEPLKTDRERFVESFQNKAEQLTALQLLHTSLELTESDFRRIIPKGKHIESWASEGEFVKVIPGRDPISLERLPFYYIVFRSPEAALAYQNNASRLHKLCQLHQPKSIFSAIPPPRGFMEDGEDLGLLTSSYLLKPSGTPLNLNMVMKPYNPALRELIEQGGYAPVVRPLSPSRNANDSKKVTYKVLLKIEGHEPLPSDIFRILRTDAYARGLTWPFHNQQKGIQRLRDVVDLKAKIQTVSADNPRAWNPKNMPAADAEFDILSHHHDRNAAVAGADPAATGTDQLNQILMNRVYNRWLIEFEDEQAARRFARIWNMRPFPIDTSPAHWMGEAQKMCTTEFLW